MYEAEVGERGRIGGVPNRGGLPWYEFLSAAARADSPGPEEPTPLEGPRPGKGDASPDERADPSCPGVGICRTGGVPVRTGEPNLAMEAFLEWEPTGDPPKPGDGERSELGTARGVDRSLGGLESLAMIEYGCCCFVYWYKW